MNTNLIKQDDSVEISSHNHGDGIRTYDINGSSGVAHVVDINNHITVYDEHDVMRYAGTNAQEAAQIVLKIIK